MRGMTVVCALFAFAILCRADDDDRREAAAVQAAKVTPLRAAEVALKEVAGGTPFEMEVDVDEGPPHYDFCIALGGDRHHVAVGCDTGQVMKHRSEGDLRLSFIKWKNVLTPMAKAMETALEKVNGQIIRADLTNGNFDPKFEIDVFADGRTMKVEVNTLTGQVLKVEQDHGGHHDGHHDDHH